MPSLEKLKSDVLKYSVHITWKGNVASEANIRKFSLIMDTDTDGRDTGPNPTEVLLSAFGGCMMVNYGRISKKMHLKIDETKISLVAERPQMTPKITKIKYTVKIKSDEDPKKLKRLRRLVEENGTVFNTVKNGTELEGIFEIDS